MPNRQPIVEVFEQIDNYRDLIVILGDVVVGELSRNTIDGMVYPSQELLNIFCIPQPFKGWDNAVEARDYLRYKTELNAAVRAKLGDMNVLHFPQ